jgi:hypothetical protein
MSTRVLLIVAALFEDSADCTGLGAGVTRSRAASSLIH